MSDGLNSFGEKKRPRSERWNAGGEGGPPRPRPPQQQQQQQHYSLLSAANAEHQSEDFSVGAADRERFFGLWKEECTAPWVTQDDEELLAQAETCEAEWLARAWAAKDRLDILFDQGLGQSFYAARNVCFPADCKGSGRFSNRSGDKLATVLQAVAVEPAGERQVWFADLCGGPGAFSQYFLARCRENRGFGMTLMSETVQKNNLAWYPMLRHNPRFTIEEGDSGDGNIYLTDNLLALRRTIHQALADGAPLSYVVSDGGFGIKSKKLESGEIVHKENLQEAFSLRIIASELLGALLLLSPGGHFVCKIFDTLSHQTASLILITSLAFRQCFVVKPGRSRQGNSEKYLVGVDFQAGERTQLLTGFLEKLHREWRAEQVPEAILPLSLMKQMPPFLERMRALNKTFLSVQQSTLNTIMQEVALLLRHHDSCQTYLSGLQRKAEHLSRAKSISVSTEPAIDETAPLASTEPSLGAAGSSSSDSLSHPQSVQALRSELLLKAILEDARILTEALAQSPPASSSQGPDPHSYPSTRPRLHSSSSGSHQAPHSSSDAHFADVDRPSSRDRYQQPSYDRHPQPHRDQRHDRQPQPPPHHDRYPQPFYDRPHHDRPHHDQRHFDHRPPLPHYHDQRQHDQRERHRQPSEDGRSRDPYGRNGDRGDSQSTEPLA